MIVFSEWLNANEVRRYPLHDAASGVLPDNILVDARLWVPKSAGSVVFVSSVGITGGLVTLTFLATGSSPFLIGTGPSPGFVPLAAVRASRPVTKFRNIAVEALYPGVGGWVALGEGAVSIGEGFWRFAGPAETQLNERCATMYDDAAVSGAGKESGNILRGLITLRGEPGVLKTFKAVRTVEGVPREVAVVAMNLEENGLARLREYAGPCGGRPYVGTCKKPPIERIGSVEPDDNGNIEMIFEGDAVVGDVQRGIVVDFPVGLDDICPESIDDQVPFPPPGGPPSPVPPEPPPEPSSSSAEPSSSSGLPEGYCEDFEEGYARELSVIQGVFAVEDVAGRSKRYVSAPGLLTPQFSVDSFRRLDINDGMYTVEGIIRPREAEGNGFLVAGFKNDKSFVFAGLSLREGGKFFVGHKVNSGGAWPNGLGQGYVFDLDFEPNWPTPPDTDYQTTFSVYTDSLVEVKFEWNDGSEDRTQTQLVVLATLNERGYAGLGAVASETEFDNYGINCGEWPSSSSSSSEP